MVDYDPFSDEALDDPNSVYKRLRAESPVHFLEKYDAWALTLFEDIWNLSMDTRCGRLGGWSSEAQWSRLRCLRKPWLG